MDDRKCINCGADYGLHQASSMRCPHNGLEALPGRDQIWDATTYTPEPDVTNDRMKRLELRVAQLEAIVARAGIE